MNRGASILITVGHKRMRFDRAYVTAKSVGRSRKRVEKSLEGIPFDDGGPFSRVQVKLPFSTRSPGEATFIIVCPNHLADMDVRESNNIEDGTSAARGLSGQVYADHCPQSTSLKHLRPSARSAVSPDGWPIQHPASPQRLGTISQSTTLKKTEAALISVPRILVLWPTRRVFSTRKR